MRYRALPSLAVAVALLVGTGCGGDDDNDAKIDSGRPTDGMLGSSTTVTPTGDDNDDDDDTSDRTPAAGELDVAVRHPNGVSVELSRIDFEGEDIVIDAVVINPSRETITFHPGNHGSDRLRLVDDAGNEYNFIEVEEDEAIKLDPGDNLDAKLAFRGPLWDEPAELRLVTNVFPDSVDGYDLDSEYDATIVPGFVVPIPLTWS